MGNCPKKCIAIYQLSANSSHQCTESRTQLVSVFSSSL